MLYLGNRAAAITPLTDISEGLTLVPSCIS